MKFKSAGRGLAITTCMGGDGALQCTTSFVDQLRRLVIDYSVVVTETR